MSGQAGLQTTAQRGGVMSAGAAQRNDGAFVHHGFECSGGPGQPHVVACAASVTAAIELQRHTSPVQMTVTVAQAFPLVHRRHELQIDAQCTR